MDWIDKARKQREIDFEPKYGPIRPKTDSRCFMKEALFELLDAVNYSVWATQKGEISMKRLHWLNLSLRRSINIIRFACEDRWLSKVEGHNEREV